MSDLRNLGIRIATLDGKRQSLEEIVQRNRAVAAGSYGEADDIEKVMAIIRGLEGEYRGRIEGGLERIISHGLTVVRGEPSKVVLETSTFRDTTSIEVMLEQNGSLSSPMDERGGTMVQILAFLWRVYTALVNLPPLARTLILDEPFSQVSEEYRPAMAELLQELHDQLGFQFIIFTHERELIDAAGLAYEVYLKNDPTRLAGIKLIKSASEEATL